MKLFEIIAKYYKPDLYEAIQQSREFQYKSEDEIKKIQEEKLINLLEHAKLNVPYYGKILKKINSIDDLVNVNFLTKKVIKENFEDLKAKNIEEDRFLLNSTSGSTSESTVFYRDRNNMNLKAAALRGDSWAGLNTNGKSFYLWGAERDIEKNLSLYKKIKYKFFTKKKIFSTYHLKEEDLKNFIGVINNYKPSVIVSYPSPLYYFTKFIEANNIKIYSPNGVITSAETLFPFQRKLIEKIFNTKVYNRYGSREFGDVAIQCGYSEGLHISTDRVVVEIINEEGEIAKPNELGEIVITDLDNYVFPFIRYKIGDLGTLSNEKCECGRNLPLLKSIEGRVFDLIVGKNNNLVGGTFWTLLRNKVVGFEKFQVVQEKLGSVHIIMEKNSRINSNTQTELINQVKQKLGNDMDITVEIIDKIPSTKTGKHRWIISKVSPYAT